MTSIDQRTADLPIGTPVGPPHKSLRVGDLIYVEDPRRAMTPFLGMVVGAYQLGSDWHVRCATPPGSRQPKPPLSTKARYIVTAYRRPRKKENP